MLEKGKKEPGELDYEKSESVPRKQTPVDQSLVTRGSLCSLMGHDCCPFLVFRAFLYSPVFSSNNV